MILLVDDRFRAEAKRFALRFTCESCAYFDEDRGVCSHAFPNEAHRRIELERMVEVTFCKEFELA